MKKINKGALKRKAKSLAKKVLYKGKTRGRVLAKKAVKRFFIEEKRLRAIINKRLYSKEKILSLLCFNCRDSWFITRYRYSNLLVIKFFFYYFSHT